MSLFPIVNHVSSSVWKFVVLLEICMNLCLMNGYLSMDLILLLFNDFCRYSMTKALCIAFVMTFFSVFDVPVFWPILLCYWIVLFVLTMRRQIAHMIKYKYIPLNIGKQVSFN